MVPRMTIRTAWAGILVATALGLGCADDIGSRPLFGGDEVVEWTGTNECVEPRMEICTKEYRPVCGRNPRNDARRTYSNKCEACSDRTVTEWRLGTCAELTAPRQPRTPIEP
jgi:hypothetical protein